MSPNRTTLKQNKNALTFEDNDKLFLFLNEQKNLANALINSAAALNSTLNLDEVLDQIFINLSSVVPYDTANIMLVDEKNGLTARIAATSGYDEKGIKNLRLLENLTLNIQDTLTLRTMVESGKPIKVPDTNLDPNWIPTTPWIRSYAAAPIRVKEKIIGFLNLNSKVPGVYNDEQTERLQAFSNQAGIAINNAQLMTDIRRSYRELEAAYDSTLLGWARCLEIRDHETKEHTKRTVRDTIKLACRMGVKEPDLTQIKRGVWLHDIGKIGVPDYILLKEGALNEAERTIMRQHPIYANDILGQIKYLEPAISIPYCHHEKWDGTGYPRQLKGEDIPFAARIFSIIDVWDALISQRPYHPPWDRNKALTYIREQSGKHFDPQIVEKFLRMVGSYNSTISAKELSDHLDDKNFIIVDCRFDLTNPKQGFKDYQSAHIQGAYYAHLDHDLASPVTDQTGRHPLPDPKTFSNMLAGWGANHNSQFVVYDNTGGSIAARLWWLLRYFGFDNTAVLDGGFDHWINENLPVETKKAKIRHTGTIPELFPHPEMVVTTPELENILQSGDYLLLDARAPARFEGKAEPIDAVAGHIPGAINRFHEINLNEMGLLKSEEELQSEFEALFKNYSTDKIVVYCGSGVTSCHHLLAMEKAGIEGGRLYVGSWSEWIRDPNRPIEKI